MAGLCVTSRELNDMGFWQKSMIAVACSKPLRAVGEAVGRKTGLAAQFVSAGDGKGHVARASALKAGGIRISSFYLGEYVTDITQVRETIDQLRAVMPSLHQAGLDVHVSIDPSQLGYMQGAVILTQHVDEIASQIRDIAAQAVGGQTVRLMIDMEDFDMVDDTLALHHRLQDAGIPVAQTLQARLHRTQQDMKDMIARGAMVRLVKGAMAPPASVAFTERPEIDANYLALAGMMLSDTAEQNRFSRSLAVTIAHWCSRSRSLPIKTIGRAISSSLKCFMALISRCNVNWLLRDIDFACMRRLARTGGLMPGAGWGRTRATCRFC